MPVSRFPTNAVLREFLATDERLSDQLADVQGEITLRGREDAAGNRTSQRVLTRDRLAHADDFVRTLARICPWIELAGVSGSTAYAGAKPGDDVDMFIVTARRRLWISLFLAMVMARSQRLRSRDSPLYCFNRIVDRADCERTFRDTREPLFAREALTLAILRGQELYGRLLASAHWMETSFPRLYAQRVGEIGEAKDAPRRKWLATSRIPNGAAFLVLGPYLWLAGLVRNARLRQAGREQECFRTIVRPDRYATESTLYDELREAYRQAFA